MTEKERNSCLQNHDQSAEDENSIIIHSLSTQEQERIKQIGKLKTALKKKGGSSFSCGNSCHGSLWKVKVCNSSKSGFGEKKPKSIKKC